MIVRREPGALVLITQPDHAALARRIMEVWTADGLPASPYRASILRAVGEHDNGWREVDAALSVGPDGEVLDFVSVPVDVRQSLWPRAVERLADDPLAAALVAEHALTVYGRFEGDPAWTPFFARMAGWRARMAAASRLTSEELGRAYVFVRLADLLSLTFCSAWSSPQSAFDYQFALEGARLAIDPDPFGGAAVPLEAPARRIGDERLHSRDAAMRAWESAERLSIRGEITPAC